MSCVSQKVKFFTQNKPVFELSRPYFIEKSQMGHKKVLVQNGQLPEARLYPYRLLLEKYQFRLFRRILRILFNFPAEFENRLRSSQKPIVLEI